MLSNLWAKVKVVLSGIWADTKDTYSRIKIYLLAILALLITLEFRKLKEYLLLRSAQQEMKSDVKEDASLAGKENAANNQANQLIQDANNLPQQQPPVTEDWYKKK